jgi:apolipoprotein N-acyltransferase
LTGRHFMVNVTNDGWFGRSTGPWQHLAQARLRAIEQGLPVLRAANTGISAVIDSHGRYLHRLPLMEAGVIDSRASGEYRSHCLCAGGVTHPAFAACRNDR